MESLNNSTQNENFQHPGYVDLDDKGNIIDINLAAVEVLGIRKSDAVKSFMDFLVEDEVQRFKFLMDHCKQTAEPLSDSFRFNSQTSVSSIYITIIPINSNGIIYYKIIFDPLSARKKNNKTLYESEKRFRLMADNSPVMIWMTNAENQLEYMNKTKLEFLGRDLKDLTNEGWMETRHPDDRERFLNALQEASKEKKNFSIEIRVQDKGGEYRWLLDSASPRFLDDDTFAGFIGSGIDITEEKNFRRNLQRSLKEKEILLTEIHHRVKNNLQVISSLLSLQTANVNDDNILAMFQTSRDRIKSMAVLHEKLYQSNNIHKVNLREYIDDLLSYLMNSYRHSLDIDLKLNVNDFEVSIGVCLNAGLILNELVSNALKHAFKGMEKGEIYVEVLRVEDDKIRIIVRDNGIGIPADYNIEKSKSVGLMLVKTLAEQHNGLMEFSGNGSTEFRVYLQYLEELAADFESI